MKYVNQPIVKKDAYALLSGKPVYCDDLALKDCLIIKLLRSPHAHARIKSIDTTLAKKVPGIEAVYTYEDVPQERFTLAGQTYPEPSPYDRQIPVSYTHLDVYKRQVVQWYSQRKNPCK